MNGIDCNPSDSQAFLRRIDRNPHDNHHRRAISAVHYSVRAGISQSPLSAIMSQVTICWITICGYLYQVQSNYVSDCGCDSKEELPNRGYCGKSWH